MNTAARFTTAILSVFRMCTPSRTEAELGRLSIHQVRPPPESREYTLGKSRPRSTQLPTRRLYGSGSVSRIQEKFSITVRCFGRSEKYQELSGRCGPRRTRRDESDQRRRRRNLRRQGPDNIDVVHAEHVNVHGHAYLHLAAGRRVHRSAATARVCGLRLHLVGDSKPSQHLLNVPPRSRSTALRVRIGDGLRGEQRPFHCRGGGDVWLGSPLS